MTESDMLLAARLADAAGAAIRPFFRKPFAMEAKADLSPVTEADRAAESAMRAILAEERPDDGVIGEEYGRDREDAERVWVLDPIDGTRSFITGSPLWGTLIALVRGGTVELGMVDMPVLGERWVGQAGVGANRNGRAVRVRDCKSVAEARIVTTSPDIFNAADWQAFDKLSRQCAMRRFGGDCYGYAQLAGGTVDLVVETGLQPYDYLGPTGLIQAAGGMVSDWEGRPLGLQSDGRVIAAATPELHRQALALLAA